MRYLREIVGNLVQSNIVYACNSVLQLKYCSSNYPSFHCIQSSCFPNECSYYFYFNDFDNGPWFVASQMLCCCNMAVFIFFYGGWLLSVSGGCSKQSTGLAGWLDIQYRSIIVILIFFCFPFWFCLVYLFSSFSGKQKKKEEKKQISQNILLDLVRPKSTFLFMLEVFLFWFLVFFFVRSSSLEY